MRVLVLLLLLLLISLNACKEPQPEWMQLIARKQLEDDARIGWTWRF